MQRASVVVLLAVCLAAPVVTRSDQKGLSKTGTTLSPGARSKTSAYALAADLVCTATAYEDEAGTKPVVGYVPKLTAWVFVTVQNRGTAPASNFMLGAKTGYSFAGVSQNASGPFSQAVTFGPMSLAPAASSKIRMKWQGSCPQDGDHMDSVTISVDSTQAVSEANEQNNTCAVSLAWIC
jgi:hypothetical protein